MGIEQSGRGGKGKVSNESKKSKRRQRKLSPVQRLYETCKEVFADCGPGIVPSSEKVETLAALLDGITQVDVGLRPSMPFFSSERASVITYLHLHECDKFSIGIFCLPPTSVIPLHNHPGMTVFSKLLFGTMHIKSYDWSDEVDKNTGGTMSNGIDPKSYPDGLRLAKLKVNSEFTAPCGPSILYPTEGGNMHCFTARTACAVLDVLGPPYCDPEGRHCQYYYDYPFGSFSVENVSVADGQEEGYAWLKEREKPEDLSVVGVPYSGPKIARK
ncbi:UNVERIFIED_CONTAM: Plant cysteine oxidase 2 [Sesamum angustifolium]|uniref:cysteine dioxygenase n=1 Tax=Sesamum angustifolium TaxID=2727405 RepID=A0AAW2NKY8_9LAMI